MHLEEDPVISAFGASGDWKPRRSGHLKASHVNVQELFEICEEAKRLCNQSLAPLRQINLSDSAVSLGAWGKFRSSSFKLNQQLRSVAGWLTLSRKVLGNVHVRSKKNPGDPPSRFQEIVREIPPEWLEPYLRHVNTLHGLKVVNERDLQVWLETFAGCAELTCAWKKEGLVTSTPIECFKDGVIRVLCNVLFTEGPGRIVNYFSCFSPCHPTCQPPKKTSKKYCQLSFGRPRIATPFSTELPPNLPSNPDSCM